MNTVESKNIESETVTIKRNSSGLAVQRTDAHGRHLFFVEGDIYTGPGMTSKSGIRVWALSARDARNDGHKLYEKKHNRTLYVNRAYMPIY